MTLNIPFRDMLHGLAISILSPLISYPPTYMFMILPIRFIENFRVSHHFRPFYSHNQSKTESKLKHEQLKELKGEGTCIT